MTNYESDILNLLDGETPKQKYEYLLKIKSEVKDNQRIEIATKIMAGFCHRGMAPNEMVSSVDYAFEIADSIIERGRRNEKMV